MEDTMGQELKNNPLTVAGLVLLACLVWNGFTAGRQTAETYATKADLASLATTFSRTEDGKHETMTAEFHGYSDGNRSKMEAKFVDYQTQTSQTMSTTNAQLQIQGVKIDQLMQMMKDLTQSQSHWGVKK